MIAIDIILLASLAVYLIAWWVTKLKNRNFLLLASSLIAIGTGLVGVYEHRWQGIVGAAVATVFLIYWVVARIRNTKVRQTTPWFSGTIVTLLVVVSCLPVYLFPVTNLPNPSGQHLVGTRTFELVDSSRLGVLNTQVNTPRRLLVRVWYPASETSGFTARPYFSKAEVNSSAGDLFSNAYFLQYLKFSETNSYVNAPLTETKAGRKFPTVFYSHGYMSFAGQNTVLMEELASHGYVVYAVQHTYESQPTVFPNGDIEETITSASPTNGEAIEHSTAIKKAYTGHTLSERYEGSITSRAEAIQSKAHIETVSAGIWLDDRIFVLDELARGNVPKFVEEIVRASDFNRTAQIGMSFGGSTSGALCMKDKRCAAAVNLDGRDFHGTPFAENIPVPFLMLYSDFNHPIAAYGGSDSSLRRGPNDFSYERLETAGLRSDIYRIQVKNLMHMGFSDFSLFTRSPVKELFFGAGTAIQVQNDFVLGFLDKHLLNHVNEFPAFEYEKHKLAVEKNNIDDVREWWLSIHPENQTEQVVLNTSHGDIEFAIYTKKLPKSFRNFLDTVDKGDLDGHAYITNENGKTILRFGSPENLEMSLYIADNVLFLRDGFEPESRRGREFGFVMRGGHIIDRVSEQVDDENSVSNSLYYRIFVEKAHRISAPEVDLVRAKTNILTE